MVNICEYKTYLIIIIIVMGFDFFTGIANGVKNHNLKSALMINGLFKKIGEFIIIFITILFQEITEINIIYPVLLFIMSYEGLSVLENCSSLGAPVPNVIKTYLNVVNEENNKYNNEGGDKK